MSLTPVSSDQSQSVGSLLLQQLNAFTSSGTAGGGSAGALGDLLTLSTAAQQLTKAPEEVTKALSDLLTGQKDTTGDLAQLKAYFQKNPQSLAQVLSSLQGGTATYGTSGSSAARSALLTAMMNGQSNSSDPSALLKLLGGGSTQESVFSYMGDSDSGALSLFG